MKIDCGSFIVRRRYYSHWEYLAPGFERVSLGLAATTTRARWTRHRSQALRFETRRSAARFLRREAPAFPPVEIVRMSRWFVGTLVPGGRRTRSHLRWEEHGTFVTPFFTNRS